MERGRIKNSAYRRSTNNLFDAVEDVTVLDRGAVFGDDGTDVVYGLGAAYNITQNLSVRGEWERYDFDGDDVDLLSVGLAWAF